MIYKITTLVILLALSACKQKDVEVENIENVDTTSSHPQELNEKSKTDTLSFIAFWQGLKDHKDDSLLFKNTAVFPYPYGSFINMLVTEDSFYHAKNDKQVLVNLIEREELSVYALGQKGLNSFVSENIIKTHGSLDDIYVVESKPEPIGYLAFFKIIDAKWRFVGCELIELGG